MTIRKLIHGRPARGWLDEHHLGAFLVSGVGLALAGLSLWYLIVVRALNVHDLASASGSSPLVVLEIALLGAFSAVLVYAGYWLASSPFETHRVWWAGLWTLIGLAGIAVVVTLAISLQVIRGDAPQQPSLVQTMLLSAGSGAIGGLLIGISTIRETTEAEHARRQQETLLFVNRILRHNVLNGMQVIQGNAELLETHVDDDGHARLETIQKNSDRIVSLVMDVRILVSSISGETPVKSVDPTAAMHRAIETVGDTYPSATIEADIGGEPDVVADELLETVFENLLSNAVEHNDSDRSAVTVSSEVRDEVVRVRVADDGPGIPPGKRDRYLEPGEQRKGSGGQGLGLYLVATLLDGYDGAVWFEDAEPWGTVVTVELRRSDTASGVSLL